MACATDVAIASAEEEEEVAPPQQAFECDAELVAPAQQAFGGDVELAAPAQHRFEESATHEAMSISFGQKHPSQPQSGDTLYSKLVCWSCGFGEVLGPVTFGEYVDCFCIRHEFACGLSDRQPFVSCGEGCELNAPELELGCYCKCLPVKCGLNIDPIKNKCAKPLLVVNQKNVI